MMARPTKKKTDDGQTVQKNDASVKKDVFPAEHIVLEVPYHVPIYVDFDRLNQPIARHW